MQKLKFIFQLKTNLQEEKQRTANKGLAQSNYEPFFSIKHDKTEAFVKGN